MSRLLATLGVAGVVLAACGGSSEPAPTGSFPAAPFATLATDSGGLQVEIRTSPSQPPQRGAVSVEYVIRDAAGAGVDGLALAVVPWMPAHAHGASVRPTITAEGEGRYLVTGVSLFMPGEWELRTDISGARTDRLAPAFEVQ